MMFRIASFLIWAVVAAAAVFWALRLAITPQAAPAYASVDQGLSVAGGDFAGLLGTTLVVEPELAQVAPPSQAHRFHLTGVVAPRSADSPQGLALIAIDGQPPKHFSVGSKIDGEWVLQSVGKRSASIGPAQGNALAVLELPAPPEPATGVLSASPMR